MPQTITDVVNDDGSVTRTITNTTIQKLSAQQYQQEQANLQNQITNLQSQIDTMTSNIQTIQTNLAKKVATPANNIPA